MLRQVISQMKTKTCSLDPIPTSLFKSVFTSCEDELLSILNWSLQTGIFPASLKTAMVRPILKKSCLDVSNLNNYRPVSNLSFLAKILEKLVFIQLNDFISGNNILEKFQSGFRAHHSTEMALVRVLNDLRSNADMRKVSVLVLLDLSAAFDTVDHPILLSRLHGMVGITGTALNWFKSYLTDRDFIVKLNDFSSEKHRLTCGVPQGSILGPTLFNLYMLPLGDVIRRHGINFHSYADDTQLYVAMSPDDMGPMDSLLNCILDIKKWMGENFLQLNQDKTEVLVIGSEAERERVQVYLSSNCMN
uniref:Reverse transcriptase domain-containing protein n=1 Tax=Oryzias melastigma TaxID=30732 RepID=A0A3B3DTT0_ORYME